MLTWFPSMTRGQSALLCEMAAEKIERRSGAVPLTWSTASALDVVGVLAHRVAQREGTDAATVLRSLKEWVDGGPAA